ncbi:ferredoxin [Promicromonospora umidemergens]|uniref:Ferredoxin n=1 Tax=Promicromonospora umidemergens TaxID=629679 RepID=A0ABP8YBK8_9MICO|nr:ferredoxin [Promicromonospora umidemergens]MCP2286734.1 ferredoxin [Promicromonospora umidemergens]
MKIVMDRAKCTGIGICEALAPTIFEVDDNGELVVLSAEVPEDAQNEVTEAVEGCPTMALRLQS